MIGHTARALAIGGLALAAIAGPLPAAAQDADTAARIKALEAEVRALQRKVFPGGDGKYFEPQITGQAAPATSQAAPSSTALTDVLARLDALESQLQRLTAQYEEGSNTVRLLSERVARLEGGAAGTAEPAATPPASAGSVPVSPAAGTKPPATPAATKPQPVEPPAAEPASKPAPKPAAQPAPKPAGPSAERVAAVQAILKPQTDDAGEDEYTYGFRLWEAKFYPEAAQQLAMFLDKYPRHARTSYARNLLGRAYLDDGKPKDAAPWFLKNYQSDKAGERAGDSLLYLSEAMLALKDTKRACIALAEFSDNYPALATGRLASQYEADRTRAKCN